VQKLIQIIKREYKTRVRKKSFIITTLIAPLIMASFILIPILISELETEDTKIYNVIDFTDEIFEELEYFVNSFDKKLYNLKKIEYEKYNFEDIKKRLSEQVLEKEIDAYIIIPEDVYESNYFEYYARTTTDFTEFRRLESYLSNIINQKRLANKGYDINEIRDVFRDVNLKAIKVTKSGEKEEKGQTFLITYVLVLILYMSVIMYGVSVMRGVIEEKQSRIVEIILSSVKPFKLMLGKLLGIGAVGLTQILIYAFFGILLMIYSSDIASIFSSGKGIPTEFFRVPASIFIYFAIYYILGYFLLSVLYAGIGAIVNSEEEAQNIQFPVIMLFVIPMLFLVLIIKNPESTISTVLSLFPFFTPILMFARINVSTPPFFQIVLSIVIMIATIFFLVWLVSKIYRVGILMYGKRPTVKEVFKWVKY